jgi:molybdopterin-containing oxidoreductase family membrane subunit
LLGVLAAGWRGSARDWERWHRTYRLIALIGISLAVLLQSVVALLLAVSPLAGWHTTLFPALFVAGAMLSGIAVVTLLAITLRSAFRVRDLVTDRHVEGLAKLLLAMGLALAYGYLMEVFAAWYAGDAHWLAKIEDRFGGTYAWSTWATILGNVVAIQWLWSPRVRASDTAVFLIALAAMVGMWFERFALIVTGLYHGYLPAYWDLYAPTAWEWLMFAGTAGLFLFLVLLFIRFLPLFGIVEVKALLEQERLDLTPGEVDYGRV